MIDTKDLKVGLQVMYMPRYIVDECQGDMEPIDWTPVLARLKSNASYAVDPRLLDDTDLDDFSMSRGGTD